jgi:hypothetical protein
MSFPAINDKIGGTKMAWSDLSVFLYLGPQTLLLTFVKLLVMMTVAIILGGDPRNTTFIWSYFKGMTFYDLDSAVVQALFIQSLQQSVVTEPITRFVEGLLFRTSQAAGPITDTFLIQWMHHICYITEIQVR